MNHPYYATTPASLARRATVPISPNLVPPASVIDPSLQNPSNPTFQFTSHTVPHPNYPRLRMANHSIIPPPPNQSIQQPQQQHQLPRKMQPPEENHQSEPEQSSESEQPSPERSLPNKDVTEENIDTAYAEFIMYCNPSIPQDVETDELKRGFRNPPRSDGNSFSPWTLFNLLQKLEKKEIKTWSHLVMELGVEPPDPEKNQSAQKVQQYAVRLKVSLTCHNVLIMVA